MPHHLPSEPTELDKERWIQASIRLSKQASQRKSKVLHTIFRNIIPIPGTGIEKTTERGHDHLMRLSMRIAVDQARQRMNVMNRTI